MSRKKRRCSGAGRWLRRQFKRELKPIWLGIVAHILVLGIALLIYALPHHVIPHGEASLGLVSSRERFAQTQVSDVAPEPVREEDRTAVSPTPGADAGDESPDPTAALQPEQTPEPSPEPSQEPSPEPTEETDPIGSFKIKYADRFTGGEVEMTDGTYRSANVNVTISSSYIQSIAARAYVADIYVADITCLSTAFGKDKYGRGYTEWITSVASRKRAVVAINGDYYGSRDTGIVIRNGMLYRDNKNTEDVAVLYWDGHMEVIPPKQFDAKTAIMDGAYQCWCFGPSLLDEDGRALQKFNCSSRLARKNPRTAIGYYEPGHYCFVTVDGRSDDSFGASMEQLAALMEYLGCKVAYNLDGGQTSLMSAGGKLVNKPSEGGRNSSDYILIVDGA